MVQFMDLNCVIVAAAVSIITAVALQASLCQVHQHVSCRVLAEVLNGAKDCNDNNHAKLEWKRMEGWARSCSAPNIIRR